MVALYRRRAHPSADQADGLGAAAVRLRRHRSTSISRPRQGRGQRRHLSYALQPATSANLPAAQDFIALVRKTYNKPPDYVHAQAFDAINIAVAAIERAKMYGPAVR